MKIIAHIYTDLDEKFGLPRQSGLVKGLGGRIVFEPEYRSREALTGLEGYSHIWIIWQFSESIRENFTPTVRPPRLGGNTYMGVFATRSPFRPNPIGLSSVRLEGIDYDAEDGPQLIVSGVDMMSGTPIYDIKPYLSYTDSHPEAVCGFADRVYDHRLKVVFPEELLDRIPAEKREALIELLEQDVRPGYKRAQMDEERIYGVSYAGFNVRFKVSGDVLTVVEVGYST